MITFFTTPEPFRGHIDVVQRNAIESWERVHPSVEVIIFGDEEGANGSSPALLAASSRCVAIVVAGGHLLPGNGKCNGERSLRAG